MYGLRFYALVKYLRNGVLHPDPEIMWTMRIKPQIKKAIQEHPDISAVLISAGPFSLLSLARHIKTVYGIPIVCEFRDEWTTNPHRRDEQIPKSVLAREIYAEREALLSSSAIVYLSKIMQSNFETRYPFLRSYPSAVIPNGYDDSDFDGLSSIRNVNSPKVIHYSGSLYGPRQPDKIWDAVNAMLEEGCKVDFRIDIHGNNSKNFVLGKFKTLATIQESVFLHPFVNHRRSIELMLQSDILLLFIASGTNSESVLTGKLFDYLRSAKPILAVVPPRGLAADLLRQYSTAFIADPEDTLAIKQALRDALDYVSQLSTSIKTSSIQGLAKFDRKNLTAQLAEMIHKLTP